MMKRFKVYMKKVNKSVSRESMDGEINNVWEEVTYEQ